METLSRAKRLRKTHTGTILGCLLAYGLVSAVIGGTLDDLQDIYQVTADGVSQILVTRNVGNLVGSFVCGAVFKHVNAKIIMILSLVTGGVGTAIVPDFAPHFWIAHVGLFMTGFSFGALEVGANVWIVQLWEEKVNPIMQSYHVFYGLGALLAPIATTPFLGPEKNKTLNSTTEVKLEVFELDPEPSVNGTSHIALPYAAFGGLYSFMGLVILFFFMIDRTVLRQHSTPEADETSSGGPRLIAFEWIIVALLSVYIVVEVTLESIMSNMLALYATRNPYLGIDKTEANYLLTFFWTTYTVGRMSSILVSLKLKPAASLILAQTMTTIGTGALLLLVFPATAGRTTAWTAVGILGFGIAPLYPTAFTWAVRYIHLKYAHMSTVLIAACAGGMLPTYLVAPWIETSITAMPGVTAGCSVLLICILTVMLLTTKSKFPIYERDEERNLVVNADNGSGKYS